MTKLLSAYKEMVSNEFEATLCMLNACLDRCPEESWDDRVVNLKFCQACFHVLFYVDFYLGESEAGFTDQPFHLENEEFFRDYEELQDRKQELLYDKAFVRKYLAFCRGKAADVFEGETEESLSQPCKFQRRSFTRAELHVYNLRHLAHHVAQLSLRLRIDHNTDVPWVGVGWKELA